MHDAPRAPVAPGPKVPTARPATARASEVGHHTRLLLDPEHRERTAEAEPDRQAQREVEDLLVGEVRVQAVEEVVVDGEVVDGEALGVLDGQPLTVGVSRPRAPLVDVAVRVLGDPGVDHRLRARR